MFTSKTKRRFKEAKGLVKNKNWNEAIALLSSLEYEPELDSTEVSSLLQQAKQGLAQQQIDTAKKYIRKKHYQNALVLLESIATRYPDHPDLARLVGQAKDGIEHAERAKRFKSKLYAVVGGLVILVMVISAISNSHERQVRNDKATQTQQSFNAMQLAATLSVKKTEIAYWNTATAVTWTPTSTYTESPTPTHTLTPTNTSTYTTTPSRTPTYTPSHTPTLTNTYTPTITRTPTNTVTNTVTPSPTLTYTPSNTPVYAVIKSDNINARICPSLECDVYRIVSSGEQIVVLGVDNDWYWVQFHDLQRAYIFNELIQLPEQAVVALAPTITPSFTPTSTFTSTPTPTGTNTPPPTHTLMPTATPFQIDEKLVLDLIKATTLTTGYPVTAIRIENSILVVDVPDTDTTDSDIALNYRMGYIGALTGAIATAYQWENITAIPPQRITVNFKLGDITMVRVRYAYQDAVNFINGKITALEFFQTWTVE